MPLISFITYLVDIIEVSPCCGPLTLILIKGNYSLDQSVAVFDETDRYS